MPDEIGSNTDDAGASGSAESIVDTGGELGASGESAETNGEPSKSGAGLFDGMTPEQLHSSYKELQRTYTGEKERLRAIEQQFERFGGHEKMLALVQSVARDPEFRAYMEAKRQKHSASSILGTEKLTPEQRQAFDLVRKISVAEAQKLVAPLVQRNQQEIIANHLKTMDEQHPGWQDYKKEMAELSKSLPAQKVPTLEDVEDLYWRAVRKSGNFEKKAAEMYQRSLKLKQQKAGPSERGKAPAGAADGKVNTIADAFRLAKQTTK